MLFSALPTRCSTVEGRLVEHGRGSRERMAEADRIRWNERHAAGNAHLPPVPRLLEIEALIRPAAPNDSAAPPPRALDLACGLGRHSLYLARLGYAVDAWDVSDVALDRLERMARDEGLGGRVHVRQIDLDDATLPAGAYDLVVDTYFLDRRLLAQMQTAVKPGGLLFLETLLSTPQKPGRPDYYLQPGELRSAFPSTGELFYREDADEGWAALLARRPAARNVGRDGMLDA
jgi:SAM-dependent methyltransferase